MGEREEQQPHAAASPPRAVVPVVHGSRACGEGTGTPVWLVTKSTNSRNHEIKVKTKKKKKKSRYLGPPVVLHMVRLL